MKFEKKVFSIKDMPKREIWVGEKNSAGKYNSIAVVDVKEENKPGRLYFGQVYNDYFHGLGVFYYSDNQKDSFVGKFVGGRQEVGVRFENDSLTVKDFMKNNENIFLVSKGGDWAYIERADLGKLGYRRAIRYLKETNKLEFIGFKGENDVDIFSSELKGREIDFSGVLDGETVYQNLYGCTFEHLSYNSITARLDDFSSSNGSLSSGEGWEDCAQKVNGENNGLGAIRWDNQNFYFGEWLEGWRTGFGMYHYVSGQYFSFCNYKKGDYTGDVRVEYSEKFDTLSVYFRDVNVHAYMTLNKQSCEDSVFGITNDGKKLSLDVFNDFSISLFTKTDGGWKALKSIDFSLDDGPKPHVGGNDNNNAPKDKISDLFEEFFRDRILSEDDNSADDRPTGRSEPPDAEVELNKLIGLQKVKEKVEYFKASAKKRRGKANLNFAFVGNPGTGKTVVARLFAQILHKSGLLPTSNLVEVGRNDLVGQYIGETEKKTTEVINRAMGGTLFIDEAYSLCVTGGSGNDFGKQAVEILLKVMEDKRGELAIILAGYPTEMHNFFKMNSGFRSRIPEMNYIEFENYNEQELRLIAKKMIEEDPDIDNVTDEAFEEIIRLILRDAYKKNFDNARCVRNVLNAVLEKQILRTKEDVNDHNIIIDDVKAISDPVRKEGYIKAEERLNELIGLAKVKKKIFSLKNTIKKFKNKPDKLNLHMAFLGNPGTGKTEVAKLIAEIFYDEKILPTKNCIEVDPSGLIAQYVGQTSPKTHDVIQRALGGVLFIDEAYALEDDNSRGYGQEAVEALLKDMEEYRGKFCVILAGYTREMKHLMTSNPGFKSRIPDHNYIEFDDYSVDELVEIGKFMVKKDGYTMEEDGYSELKKIIEIAKGRPNFENARFVRNALQGIETVQNTRTVDTPDDLNIIRDDVIEYAKDNDFYSTETNVGGVCITKKTLLELPPVNGPVTVDFITERGVAIHTETPDSAGEGSGFIISPDGYIVTNNHVIENGTDVTVSLNYVLNNNKTIVVNEKAKIICANKEDDVAIIKIERPEGEELPYLTLTGPEDGDPALLTEVIMGGYPLGKSRFHKMTLTTGKVQSINYDERIGDKQRLIYLDLSGTHGNSGSAVIDVNTARVIGIFSGASVDRGANAEINFAIPTSYIWDLIKANTKDE